MKTEELVSDRAIEFLARERARLVNENARQSATIKALTEALELSQQALIHSEPKAKNYPEPVARHEGAIKAVRNAIAQAREEE